MLELSKLEYCASQVLCVLVRAEPEITYQEAAKAAAKYAGHLLAEVKPDEADPEPEETEPDGEAPQAEIHIYGLDSMGKSQRCKLADWLREEAEDLAGIGHSYADHFSATLYHSGKEVFHGV